MIGGVIAIRVCRDGRGEFLDEGEHAFDWVDDEDEGVAGDESACAAEDDDGADRLSDRERGYHLLFVLYQHDCVAPVVQ